MLEYVLSATLTVICAITNVTEGRISFFKTLRHFILIAALFSLVNTLTLPLAPSLYQTVRTLAKKTCVSFQLDVNCNLRYILLTHDTILYTFNSLHITSALLYCTHCYDFKLII